MIVEMKKVLLAGSLSTRESLLQKLQELGVVHIEPVTIQKRSQQSVLEEEFGKIAKAMEILRAYSAPESQLEKPKEELEISQVVTKVLELHNNLQTLKEHLVETQQKYSDLSHWGDFSIESFKNLKEQGVDFHFWKCPYKFAKDFQATHVLPQKQVGNTLYLVTVSYKSEPKAPPEAEEVQLTKGTQELQKEIQEYQKQIQEGENQLSKLSYYLEKLEKRSRELQDKIAFEEARKALLAHGEIFGLVGWVPVDRLEKLREGIQEFPVALEVTKPSPEDSPPTLLRNPRWVQSVLDIIKLYATPGYDEWDPSASVYFAFTVFFSMIVGDAGYGLLIFLLMQWLRKKMVQSDVGLRVYRLLTTLSLGCITFGALSGTWFAIPTEKLPDFLKSLCIMKAQDYNLMMSISIYCAAVHLSLARLVQILQLWNTTLWLAEIGWIAIIWGGIQFIISILTGQPFPQGLPLYLIEGGVVFVLLFSSTSWNPIKRLIGGLLGLIGITQNFADILSYLRLFALGLATTVMGGIFNQLAIDAGNAVPGFGYIIMVLIIFMGHTINLVLAIMGGFIHGLRLNFLEFYRYCFEGTGHDYRPFIKSAN